MPTAASYDGGKSVLLVVSVECELAESILEHDQIVSIN